MKKIETIYCNIVADKKMPSGNIYIEDLLRSFSYSIDNSRIGLETFMGPDNKSFVSLKVGIIKSIEFDNELKRNKLTIETSWNLEKLLKYSALVPNGIGHPGVQKLDNYEFRRYQFGAFWRLDEINKYFLNRKLLLNSNYKETNHFLNEQA